MTIKEALYNSIKEAMPKDFDIVWDNLDETKEQCGICFRGGGSPEIQFLDGRLGNRRTGLVINYNTKNKRVGYDYGDRIIEALIRMKNIGYRDEETNELLVYISRIKLMSDVTFCRKNPTNGLNCFSINFMVTYGKIKEVK